MLTKTPKSAGKRQRQPKTRWSSVWDPGQKMVRFRGLVPKKHAAFLGHLTHAERRDVYGVQGTFKEIRGLVGVARLLDLYLREAPLAAARGRTTFREFLDEKAEILRDISALLEKIHRAAENVCLILPRGPELNLEEMNREYAAAL
jgi:hypothetical protein